MSSKPINVLVFGKNGQVGGNLVSILAESRKYKVVAADIEEIDLTNTQEIEAFIEKIQPQWVINASAHTAVDRAESEEELSFALNADAPEAMAKTCVKLGSKLIHYSTDYVFDGNAIKPYTESEPTNPQSVYGRSKVAGENAVLAHLPQAIIFRTSWVYAKQGNNFVNTMLRLANDKSELSVVDDQLGSPTYAYDLAMVTVNIIDGITNSDFGHIGGIYHATGDGHTNWFEFCEAIMEEAGNSKVKINPISTAEFPTDAPRPSYSVLSNQKLFNDYGQKLPHWRDALHQCLGEH